MKIEDLKKTGVCQVTGEENQPLVRVTAEKGESLPAPHHSGVAVVSKAAADQWAAEIAGNKKGGKKGE